MRPLISVVIAVAASLVGHVVLWISGATSFISNQRFLQPDVGAIVGITVGVVIIGIAMLTVAISSAGVLLIGAVQVVSGLLGVLLTPSLGGGIAPMVQLSAVLRSIHPELSYGFDYSVLTGICLITGVIFVVAGLVGRMPLRAVPGAGLPIVAAVIAVVTGLIGVSLAIGAGFLTFRRGFVYLDGPDPISVVVLVLGALLVGVAVASARWSPVGVVVLGVIVVVLGIAETLTRFAISLPLSPVGQQGFDAAAVLGNVQLIGVLLIAAGVALWWRARRAPAASTVLAPDEVPSGQASPVV